MSGGGAGRGGARATHARLVRSRASLLRALAGATEADFGRRLDGELLVERLAELARRERDAVDGARALLAGAARPAAGPAPERRPALPPQAIHALAGARHRSLRLLDELAAPGAPGEEGARGRALALLGAVAEREERVAALLGRGP